MGMEFKAGQMARDMRGNGGIIRLTGRASSAFLVAIIMRDIY